MSVETERYGPTKGLGEKLRNWWQSYAKFAERFGFQFHFASLGRRIVFLNVFGLLLLVSGILYLNQFREGLIDAKVSSLEVQGEIIAAAISASTSESQERIQVDPQILLESTSAPGNLQRQADDLFDLEFQIDPTLVAPIVAQVIEPTGTRARIYGKDGELILDSNQFFKEGGFNNRDNSEEEQAVGFLTGISQRFKSWYRQYELPVYEDIGSNNGKAYAEVVSALGGARTPVVRVNNKGELLVSIGVPIRQSAQVNGVLLLSTQGGEIDSIISKERMAIGRVSLFALVITGLLSLILAGTIAGPMRRLSNAAIRVRKSIKAREEIPDFTGRSDEIGDLSGALREMTNALYARIEAIENFAADVSHELKNPLTSLRSAAETLPLAKSDESRHQLVDVILHDVKRLDRLISDISDASRLDAELVREDSEPIDIIQLVNNVGEIVNGMNIGSETNINVVILPVSHSPKRLTVNGHESRLGQVLNNLLDNARSFSPDNSDITVGVDRIGDEVEIVVEDSGPGIPEENLEKVFQRFYTDRPGVDSFGKNSGLGLNISRQIILAHGGRIWAENRHNDLGDQPELNPDEPAAGEGAKGSSRGARFVIRLPALN